MTEVSGASFDAVWNLVFVGALGTSYDCGEISSREFYEAFCLATQTAPGFDALLHAASDMFELNAPIVPLLAALRRAGRPLGLLSNTCPAHWEFVSRGRFSVVPKWFHCVALSFELKAAKPDPAIYRAAAELAGRPASEIIFIDDLPVNVAGARQAGWKSVPFVSVAQLLRDLDSLGVDVPL